MPELHAVLAERVAEWRERGYPDEAFPAISEILRCEDGLKATALRNLERRNAGRIVYRMIFADSVVPQEALVGVRGFLAGSD